MARFAVVVSLFLVSLASSSLVAQSDPLAGALPFSTRLGSEYESVDLATSDILLVIPVRDKAGKIPFSYKLVGNSHAYTAVVNGTNTWQVSFGLLGKVYQGSSPSSLETNFYYSTVNFDCDGNENSTEYTNFYLVDATGAVHPLPSYMAVSQTTCIPNSSTQLTTDNSGYTLSVQTPGSNGEAVNGEIYDPSGNEITFDTDIHDIHTTLTDPDGATIVNVRDGTYYDTFGQVAMSQSLEESFTYQNPSGSTTVAVTRTNYYQQTDFKCSGIQDINNTTTSGFPTSITAPQGGSYTIQYELTPGKGTGYTTPGDNGQYTTGRIGKITFPSGGSVSYTYSDSNGNNGINCTSGVVPTLTRTVSDNNGNSGEWTYTNKNDNASTTCVAGSSTPCNYTVTVISPPDPSNNNAQNNTVYNFAGEFQTQAQFYEGKASGTPLKIVLTCYNGTANTSCASPGFVPSLPISTIQTYTNFNSTNASAGSQAIVNFDFYGNVMSTYNYDFGGTSLLSGTSIQYGQTPESGGGCYAYKSGYIQNTPCYSTTFNGSGTLTQTEYNNSPTGHPTSILNWVGGNSWLTTTLAYGGSNAAPGILTSIQDPNTGTTSFSNFVCNGMVPTTIGYPLSLAVSLTWDTNCSGGVLTQRVDVNHNTWQYGYNDPMWRTTSATDPLQNTISISYTPTTQETAMTFGSSTVDHLITTDGLQRPILSQTKQGPQATNYDTQQTSYDALGRNIYTSLLCSATASQACTGGSPPGTSINYDAIYRPTSVQDSGGGTTSYTYSGRDVLQNRTGGQSFQKQFEYDGLGRIASVCEITGVNGSGTCAQANPQVGYWTEYSYAGNYLTSVMQNVQTGGGPTETRSYSYDGLDRLTSETNPENGTTQYLYDTVPSGCANSGTHFNGDLVQTVQNGVVSNCYSYDLLHRDVSEGTSSTCRRFVYDGSTILGINPPGTVSNPYGHLTEVETDNCSNWPNVSPITDEWFSYDTRGSITDTYESTPNSGGYYHVQETYAANFTVTSIQGIPGTPNISYSLDGEGRVSTVNASSGQDPVTNSVYNLGGDPNNPVGALTQVTYGSTDFDQFSYDKNTGRMTGFQFNVGTSGEALIGTLGWNANWTLGSLNITDPFPLGNPQSCSYTYDDLSRLNGISCGNKWAQTFTYDPFGNINKSGSISWQPPYNSNPVNNQYQSGWNGVSYDDNGNLLNDTFHQYTWNQNGGNLATVDGMSITYDGLGRVVETDLPSGPIQTLYGAQDKLALMQGMTLKEARVPLLGGSWAKYTSSGLSDYWHPDWEGSSRLTSTPGQTVDTDIGIAPFGEIWPEPIPGNLDYTFTGNASPDTASDLQDFLYRRYHPKQGRWISPDPAGLAAVDLSNPQTWNRYAYVMNSPLSYADPTGLHYYDCYWYGGCNGNMATGGGGGGGSSGYGGGGSACVLDAQGIGCANLGGLGGNGMAYCPQCQPGQMVDALNQIWGWVTNTPGSGVTAPPCPNAACATISLLAYWGILGMADPFDPTCVLFCGANGNLVFNQIYPLPSRPIPTVTAAKPRAPTPAMSGLDRFGWCMSSTYMRMGGGGAVPMGAPTDAADQLPVGESGTIWGPQEYNPGGNGQGAAAGNGAAMVGNVAGCYGAPVP